MEAHVEADLDRAREAIASTMYKRTSESRMMCSIALSEHGTGYIFLKESDCNSINGLKKENRSCRLTTCPNHFLVKISRFLLLYKIVHYRVIICFL